MKIHAFTNKVQAMGRNVDVKLHSMPRDGYGEGCGGWMGDVYWTTPKHRVECRVCGCDEAAHSDPLAMRANDHPYKEYRAPAGGCNSYVLVASEKGPFTFDGQRVMLVSINGIGESRWNVRSEPTGDEKEAFDAFATRGLTVA